MRIRAGVLIFNQAKREVLLTKSLHSDHLYYTIFGAAVVTGKTPLATIKQKISQELPTIPTTIVLDYLGEFDFQGNPQYCYILDAQRYQLTKLEWQTNNYQSQWVPYNELEAKLVYLPKIVDAFFSKVLLTN